MLYIDIFTGTYGGAEGLVFIDANLDAVQESGLNEGMLDNDSDIIAIGTDASENNTGISLENAVALLREVQEQKGDWRGTLDYVVQMLSD